MEKLNQDHQSLLQGGKKELLVIYNLFLGATEGNGTPTTIDTHGATAVLAGKSRVEKRARLHNHGRAFTGTRRPEGPQHAIVACDVHNAA